MTFNRKYAALRRAQRNQPIEGLGLGEKHITCLAILMAARPDGMIGLDIVARSDGVIDRSTVYVVTGDLEEGGLIRARRPRSDTVRHPRPRYMITNRGIAVLTYERAKAATISGVPARLRRAFFASPGSLALPSA